MDNLIYSNIQSTYFPLLEVESSFKAEFGHVFRFTQDSQKYDLYIEPNFPATPPRLFRISTDFLGSDLIPSLFPTSLDLSRLQNLSLSSVEGKYQIGCTFPLYLFSTYPTYKVVSLNQSNSRPHQPLNLIVTPKFIFQVAEYKNSGYLVAYGTIKSIKTIKSTQYNKGFTVVWRGTIDYYQSFTGNSSEIIEKLLENLSAAGVKYSKNIVIQKTINAEDVGPGSIKKIKIGEIESEIIETELDIEVGLSKEKVNLLIELYQKAIEYYSALGDNRFDTYLGKVRGLMGNAEVIRCLTEEKEIIVKIENKIVEEIEQEEIWPENLVTRE